METIYILFVSACMYRQCAWFEITDPKFTDIQNCYTSGKQFGMTMQTQDPRYEGQFVCVDEKDKESLEGIGCSLNMKEIKGSVYTITSDHGYEEVKEPDEIKWVIVSS